MLGTVFGFKTKKSITRSDSKDTVDTVNSDESYDDLDSDKKYVIHTRNIITYIKCIVNQMTNNYKQICDRNYKNIGDLHTVFIDKYDRADNTFHGKQKIDITPIKISDFKQNYNEILNRMKITYNNKLPVNDGYPNYKYYYNLIYYIVFFILLFQVSFCNNASDYECIKRIRTIFVGETFKADGNYEIDEVELKNSPLFKIVKNYSNHKYNMESLCKNIHDLNDIKNASLKEVTAIRDLYRDILKSFLLFDNNEISNKIRKQVEVENKNIKVVLKNGVPSVNEDIVNYYGGNNFFLNPILYEFPENDIATNKNMAQNIIAYFGGKSNRKSRRKSRKNKKTKSKRRRIY